MKIIVRIPGWGAAIYEAISVEEELAALRIKFPDRANDITVVDASQKRRVQYSDTELAAMEDGE